MSQPPIIRIESDDPPPIFGTWGRFYAVVILNTGLVYLLLLLFSFYATG